MAEQKIKTFIDTIPIGAQLEGPVSRTPRDLSAVITRTKKKEEKPSE
jgi:hypothetical protein